MREGREKTRLKTKKERIKRCGRNDKCRSKRKRREKRGIFFY